LQQFRNFKLEILNVSERSIEARMKGFGIYGVDDLEEFSEVGVTVDDYMRFFEKIWEVTADSLGLEYAQEIEGDWTVFTVTEKK